MSGPEARGNLFSTFFKWDLKNISNLTLPIIPSNFNGGAFYF